MSGRLAERDSIRGVDSERTSGRGSGGLRGLAPVAESARHKLGEVAQPSRGRDDMTAPLRMGAVVAALVIAAFAAGIAQADPNSPKIGFFGCAAGGSFAKSVPANTPLYIQSGFSSGTRGLVEAALQKNKNTFSVSYSAGGGTTFTPPFGEIFPNAGDTWTALFRVDLPALASGDSMTIQWTSTYTHPTQDLVPPSSDWDPVANFQPPWDGTGLKYQGFIAAGDYDLGTCTVTAV